MEHEQENCPRRANVMPAVSSEASLLPQTPVKPKKGLPWAVEIRKTFIHCTPGSQLSGSPSSTAKAFPDIWTEPRNCRPNLGEPGCDSDSGAARDPDARPREPPATPGPLHGRASRGGEDDELEVLTTPATYSKVPPTPSTAGSSAAREAGPTLVPKLLLYAELPSPGQQPRTPPTQLRLSDLLQHSGSTTGSGGDGSAQSPGSSTKPLRLSELLPPPLTAPPPARYSTPPTGSGASQEEAPAPTSAPAAVGRPQPQPQPERLPPKPQQPPPSLLQAIFGSPGSRNGGPGPRIVTQGRLTAKDTDDDFKPRKLSFMGAVER